MSANLIILISKIMSSDKVFIYLPIKTLRYIIEIIKCLDIKQSIYFFVLIFSHKLMSLTRQLTHNTIIQTTGKFISIFLGVLGLGIMTRYLGPERFGQYTIVISVLQFFAILADMGLMLITVQMLSTPKVDEQKMLSNLFTLRIVSSLIFLSLAPIIVIFFPYPPIVKIAISMYTLSFFMLSLIQVLTGLFQKRLKIIKVSIADVIGKSTIILFVVIAIYLDWGLI